MKCKGCSTGIALGMNKVFKPNFKPRLAQKGKKVCSLCERRQKLADKR